MFEWLGAALVAAIVLRRVAWGYPKPAARYRVLLRGEAAVLASVAEATYPAGGSIPSSGTEANIPAYVDRLMAASEARVRLLMHLLIFFIEHATLVFRAPGHRGFRRFTRLTSAQQVAVLNSWAMSDLFLRRLVFTSLRALCTLGYFHHPPVMRQLRVAPYAIEGRWCEADLLFPPIGGRPEDIAVRPEQLNAPTDEVVPIDLHGPLHPDVAEAAG